MMANTALCVGIAICFAMVLFVGFGQGICRQHDCWGITGCGLFVLLRLLVIMGWLLIAIGGLILSFFLMAMWVMIG